VWLLLTGQPFNDAFNLVQRLKLEHAAGKGSLVYPQHFAGPHIGRVSEKGGAFTYLPGRG